MHQASSLLIVSSTQPLTWMSFSSGGSHPGPAMTVSLQPRSAAKCGRTSAVKHGAAGQQPLMSAPADLTQHYLTLLYCRTQTFHVHLVTAPQHVGGRPQPVSSIPCHSSGEVSLHPHLGSLFTVSGIRLGCQPRQDSHCKLQPPYTLPTPSPHPPKSVRRRLQPVLPRQPLLHRGQHCSQ